VRLQPLLLAGRCTLHYLQDLLKLLGAELVLLRIWDCLQPLQHVLKQVNKLLLVYALHCVLCRELSLQMLQQLHLLDVAPVQQGSELRPLLQAQMQQLCSRHKRLHGLLLLLGLPQVRVGRCWLRSSPKQLHGELLLHGGCCCCCCCHWWWW
jgi:hypothetical protein